MIYLQKILPVKNSSQAYLNLSDQRLIPLHIDSVLKLGLKTGIDLSPEILEKIYGLSQKELLYNYALRQIAISPKTPTLLLRRLSLYQRKIVHKFKFILLSDLVQEVVTEVQERGLLKESDYADYLQRRCSKKSNLYLKKKLVEAGLNPSATAHRDESEIIQNLLRKKNISFVELTDFKTKNKIIGSLYRQGYSLSAIKSTIDVILKNRVK